MFLKSTSEYLTRLSIYQRSGPYSEPTSITIACMDQAFTDKILLVIQAGYNLHDPNKGLVFIF